MVDAMSRMDVVTLGEPMVLLTPTDSSPVVAADRFVLGVARAESNAAVALSQRGERDRCASLGVDTPV